MPLKGESAVLLQHIYLLGGAAQIPHTAAFTPILELFRGGIYIACNEVIPSMKQEREVDTVFLQAICIMSYMQLEMQCKLLAASSFLEKFW